MLTVKTVFPKAMLVNDRFHVQQLMTDAIDQMRIGLRWEVLAQENKAIKEHRERRKAAHSVEEKDRIGEWKPERMENGETKPKVMARSRHIILMHKSKWNAQQQARAAILFRMFQRLEEAYNIYYCCPVNKESRILYPIQIGIIASVLRPDEPNLPIQIDNQLRNYR